MSLLQSAESRKEDRAKQVERKNLSSPTTGDKRLLFLNETAPFDFPDGSVEKELEVYVASVWEDIAQNHVPEMLEALESLKYVPVKIRKKMASELLFLDRSE